MFPLDFVALPVYVFLPLALGWFGSGDLRKSDKRFINGVNRELLTPNIFVLAFSLTVQLTMTGVAAFLYWRDSSTFRLWETGLYFFWVHILAFLLRVRLVKMHQVENVAANDTFPDGKRSTVEMPIATAIVSLLGEWGCALALIVCYGINGTETGVWAPFGIFFIPFIIVTLMTIWTLRLTLGPVFRGTLALPGSVVKAAADTMRNTADMAEAGYNRLTDQSPAQTQSDARIGTKFTASGNLIAPTNASTNFGALGAKIIVGKTL